MSTNPEESEAAEQAAPAAETAAAAAETVGAVPTEQDYGVSSVTIEGGDPSKPGWALGLAITAEALLGLAGVIGGIALAAWGGFMIKDGVQGQVAFTLHFGENNSLDVNTAVVGVIVMLIGLGFALLVRGKVDWKGAGKTPSGSPGDGGG